jgi:hypothetical protein
MKDHQRDGLIVGGLGVIALSIFVVWPLLTSGAIPISQTTQTRFGDTPILFSVVFGVGATILGFLFWTDIYYPN